MSMPKLLTVRPYPKNNESFKGYVVRLAYLNGWLSLKKFLTAVCGSGSRTVDVDKSTFFKQIVTVTGHYHLEPNQFYPDGEYYFSKHTGATYGSLLLDSVHVCPDCMHKNAYHRTHWSYLPFTYCSKHKQKLLRECPRCHESFSWNSTMATGCIHCNQPWLAMHSENQSVIPPYLQSYYRSRDKDRFLTDLITATQCILRPFDELIDHQARVPKGIHDWHTQLTLAYSILTKPETIQAWLAGCLDKRKELYPLGNAAVYAPILRLINELQLKRWPLKSSYFSILKHSITHTNGIVIKENHLPQLPSRTKLINTQHDFNFHTDIKGIDAIIGCAEPIASELVQQGIVNSLNGRSMARDGIYDIRDILHIIKKLTPHRSTSQHFVPLSSFQNLFSLFYVKWHHVISVTFVGNLYCEIDPENTKPLIDRLIVTRLGVLRFLVRHLKQQCEQNERITENEVLRFLCIDKYALQRLAVAGFITPLKYYQFGMRYLVTDCIDFLQDHCSIARWTVMHNYSLKQVIKKLDRQGFKSCYTSSIYHKTPELLNALRLIRIETASLRENDVMVAINE